MRDIINLIETVVDDPNTTTVWHFTATKKVRSILRQGLDPNKTQDGEKAVYVWDHWGLVLRAAKEWSGDDGDLDVILELKVPAGWLTPGNPEIEPFEKLIYHRVPPSMIKVLVPSVAKWDGQYPG